jgi:hypothetical protein
MNTILRLFYDLSVYKEIITDSLSKTIGRFLLAYLLLSLGYAVYANYAYVPAFAQSVNNAVNQINIAIPDQAVFTLTDGTLNAQNLKQPLIINDYLYLDTEATTSALATSAAAVTLNATHARIATENNAYQISSYQELGLEDFQTTGETMKSQASTLQVLFSRIRPYLPILLVAPILPALISIRLLHVLFYTLLFLLGISISKGGYRFTEILKITLHAVIVAETLNLVIWALYGTNHSTIFSIAFTGISILAYLNLPARPKLKL